MKSSPPWAHRRLVRGAALGRAARHDEPAKAITNGYFPLGAAMISDRMAETFENDKPPLPSSARATPIPAIRSGPRRRSPALTRRSAERAGQCGGAGLELFEGSKVLKGKYAMIGDVRGGHGLMSGIECVSDRGTKAPAAAPAMGIVAETTYQNGVMIRVSGPNIILSPPLSDFPKRTAPHSERAGRRFSPPPRRPRNKSGRGGYGCPADREVTRDGQDNSALGNRRHEIG